jgi:hypothetical protein
MYQMNDDLLNHSYLEAHSQFSYGGPLRSPYSAGFVADLSTHFAENTYPTEGLAEHTNMNLPIESSNWSMSASLASFLQHWAYRRDFERIHGKQMFDSFVAAVSEVTF